MKIKFLISFALLTSSAFAGIYTKYYWPHTEVTTCFAAPGRHPTKDYKLKLIPWSPTEKGLVQKWVMEEYSPERTGIHFTGFVDCVDAPDSNLVLFRNKNNKIFTPFNGSLQGAATLGYFGPYRIYDHPQANGWVIISSSGMRKRTVIHEFGHTAGLAHEHNHPDVHSNCGARDKEEGEESYLIYEPYDKESVMSYCSFNQGLSKGDVALLKKLYPSRP